MALQDWIKEHVVEISLAVIVALLGYIGKEKLDEIDEKTNLVLNSTRETACKVYSLSASDELQKFAFSYMGEALDGLSRDSAEIERLGKLVDTYKVPLSNCDEGRNTFSKVENLYVGLKKYIDRNYDAAFDNFEFLPDDMAFTHQLRSTTLYKKAALLNNSNKYAQYANMIRQSEEQASQFQALARTEMAGYVKQPTMRRYSCNLLSRTGTDTDKAIECLRKLIENRYEDHGTFLNLAIMYTRKKDYDQAITNLKLAIDRDTNKVLTLAYIHNERELDPLMTLKQHTYRTRLESALKGCRQ